MRFQSGCSLGSAGHLGPRQLSPNNSSLQPLRSATSAAEAVFLVPLDADLKVRSTRTSRIHQFWNRPICRAFPTIVYCARFTCDESRGYRRAQCKPLIDANLPAPYNEQIACVSFAIQ